MQDKMYELSDIIRAKTAMMNHLESLSGGELLRGCCTQGCCEEAQLGTLIPDLAPKYSRADMLDAKRVMLETLKDISGGVIIAGCCTQGCCNRDAIAAVINVP